MGGVGSPHERREHSEIASGQAAGHRGGIDIIERGEIPSQASFGMLDGSDCKMFAMMGRRREVPASVGNPASYLMPRARARPG